eukprot:gene15424-18292_t
MVLGRSRAGSAVSTTAAAATRENNPKNVKDLESYYSRLKKNVLDVQFEFTVTKRSDEKSRTLLVNLRDGTLALYKLGKKNKKKLRKKYRIADIDRAVKDRQDNRLMTLTLCVTPDPKKEKKAAKKREKKARKLAESGGGELKVKEKKGDKKDMTVWFENTERRESMYELIYLHRSGRSLPTKEDRASFEKIGIFVSTWNVGDAPPPSGDKLATWIPNGGQYDIYAIGVQECEYDSKHTMSGSASPPKSSSDCESHWFATLQTHLGPSYFKLDSISLVKMRLAVFVKKEHYYKINYVERDTEATGIGGIYGNKGATAISFQFLETNFCFISSHFAAHQEKTEQRNQNYKDIVKGLQMGMKSMDVLNQFHHVFWMGDFNYRVDLFREEVLLLIKRRNMSKLLAADQLARQKASDRVFFGFKEQPILFPPTYKTLRGSESTYTEEKARVPSWCDRILHRSLPYTQPLNPLMYDSARSVVTSDHVPVFAVYEAYVQTPCPPAPAGSVGTCSIHFTDLRAELEPNIEHERPDAFLTFNFCTFLANDVTTSHAQANWKPVWGDIPPITPSIHKRSYLENQHLFVTILDDNESPPRRIGYATIPLALGFNNEPYAFQTRITYRGLPAGILFGRLHIVIDNSNISTLASSNNNLKNSLSKSKSIEVNTAEQQQPSPSISHTDTSSYGSPPDEQHNHHQDSSNQSNNEDIDRKSLFTRRNSSFRKSI